MTLTMLFKLTFAVCLIFMAIESLSKKLKDSDNSLCFVYETIDELRVQKGDNSASWWVGLGYKEARELYHSILPDKCIKKMHNLNVCQKYVTNYILIYSFTIHNPI